MPERIQVFIWALSGAASFGLVGGLFGGLAGALFRAHGNAAGTIVGGAVAQAVARARDRELTPRTAGAITGAADGGLFLAVIGSLGGAIAGYQGEEAAGLLVAAWMAVLLLATAAAVLGTLAYALVRAGGRTVAGMFLGAMIGALAGANVRISDGLFYGIVLGILAGGLAALVPWHSLAWSQAPDEDPSGTMGEPVEDDGPVSGNRPFPMVEEKGATIMPDKQLTVYSEQEIPSKLKEWGLDEWYLEDGWLRRKYNTDGWPTTLMLTNAIGYLCEAAWHHADLAITWGKLWVKLKTHSHGGITDKDFALARQIEAVVLWRPESGSPLEGTPNKFVHSKK